jgi:glutathione S-transferase
MTDLEIIGLPQSNFVWATRIAIAEKGVAHSFVAADPHSPEVSAISPFGKVPVMRHGDFRLAESRAICTYVDRAFEGPSLVPREPREAALAEQWTSLVVSTIEPVLIRQYLFAYLFPKTATGQPDASRIAAALPTVHRHLDVLDGAVQSGEIGHRFTLADAYLAPILFYLKDLPESGEALASRPALRDYAARQSERPSVRATAPARPGL